MKNKNITLPIPNGFTEENIRIKSSICTGEKTIGFYKDADKMLHYAELVRTNANIDDFYRKYGVENTR